MKNTAIRPFEPDLRLVYCEQLRNNQLSAWSLASTEFCVNPFGIKASMTFFSPDKLKRRIIEIDQSVACSESPEVRRRLGRIQESYQQLETILAELESKIASDQRLQAIDDADVDFETTFGIKKKRKWRPAKTKASRKTKAKRVSAAAANPKKPR